MSTTNPIPSIYLQLDPPPDLLGEVSFGREGRIGYTDGDGRAHMVCVERVGRRHAVVDHVDGDTRVIETLDAYDGRPAAQALAVDWAIQAPVRTGRRDSDPHPDAHANAARVRIRPRGAG